MYGNDIENFELANLFNAELSLNDNKLSNISKLTTTQNNTIINTKTLTKEDKKTYI